MNIFNKIRKFFKDIDDRNFNDALDEADYIAAVIVGKSKNNKLSL